MLKYSLIYLKYYLKQYFTTSACLFGENHKLKFYLAHNETYWEGSKNENIHGEKIFFKKGEIIFLSFSIKILNKWVICYLICL